MSLTETRDRLAPLILIGLGIAVALTGWNVPANHAPMFAIALAVSGGLIIGTQQSWRAGLLGKSNSLLAYAAGTLTALATWLTVAAQCIVFVSSRGEAFFPLWLAGDIATMVDRAGGRVAALERYGLDGVRLALANMPGASVAEVASTTLLLVAFLSTFLVPTLPLLQRHPRFMRAALKTLSIFISYRREDSAPYARLIFERLQQSCRQVVLDVDVLPIGTDFASSIELAIDSSDIVIVVIGPKWLGDAGGHCRLAEPGDMVAWEVAHSLATGRPVLPVLVSGARMPAANEVPAGVAPLTRINALELRHESFKRDIVQLEEHLEGVAAKRSARCSS